MTSRFLRRTWEMGRRGPFALPVLLFLALYTAVLYWRAFAVGVLSDGWVLLEIGSRGLREAPFVLLSYHTIPVTNLFMAVLWKLFGLAEWKYQLANLAELVLVGWLIYLFGCALFRQPRAGLLASLLFLANSSFYEVPFWPPVGNFQSLTALLYLAGLFAVLRAFRSARPWPWLLLFSLCALAVPFAYEPAVSLLGVGVLAAFLLPAREGEVLSRGTRVRRAVLVILLSLPAVAAVVASKLYTASLGYDAAFLPSGWAELKQRGFLLLRGCVAIFTLVAADHKLYKILTFGIAPPGGTPLSNALLLLWALLLLAAAAFLLWKGSAAVRFVTLWFAAHMLLVSAATPVVSRHFYLGAIPAALLSGWLIGRAADLVAARIARRDAPAAERRPEAQTAMALAFLPVILLAINAKSDLDAAGSLHKEATRASRQVAALTQSWLAQVSTDDPRLVLVNMPAILTDNGLGSYAFINGLRELVRLSTARRIMKPVRVFVEPGTAAGLANVSRPISVRELALRIEDPETLVLGFDPRTRNVIELTRAVCPPPQYDAGSAPFLPWQPGAWPWFRVPAGRSFEMPVQAPGRSWMALRYLRTPGVAFSVREGSRTPLAVRGAEGLPDAWPVLTLPIDEPLSGPDPEEVALTPESEVWLAGAWPFAPPVEYTPQTAPFLPWFFRPLPAFPVEGAIQLPLSTAECAPRCALRIEYLAERGRDFTLAADGVPVRSFTFDALAAPEWRSELLPFAPVVRIEPRGRLPLFLRRFAAERAESGVQSTANIPSGTSVEPPNPAP